MATATRKHNGRKPSSPYITGEIRLGFDRQRETFHIDGPLDSEMRKIIKKYGLDDLNTSPFMSCLVLSVMGWYVLAWTIVPYTLIGA